MSYIIWEKTKDNNRTFEQIIFSCLENSGYKRQNEYIFIDDTNSIRYVIRHKRNSQRYYLEIISNLRVNKGEDALLHMDECLLKSSEQQYINIIRVYDGVSASFCERLYPKYGAFERLLRQIILLVLTKAFGNDWRNKTITEEQLNDMKRVAKAKGNLSLSDTLEQFDLASMERYLFEKRQINYIDFFDEKLKKEEILNKEKEELVELINEMRPCSLWERNFEMLGKQSKWEKQIYEIHGLRNKVAHSKKITKEEYKTINKKLNKLNHDLNDAIIKIQDKDFENVDYVDILSNFALTIGKMTQKIVANCDFSRIVNGINKVVQDMIIPLREAYNSSINESLEKIALVGKIDNHKVHTQTRKSDVTKVLTAFEAAEELKSIAKDFNNTAENDTE